MRLRVIGVMLVGAFVAGCGGQTPDGGPGEAPATTGASGSAPAAVSSGSDVSALVGLWKLAGTDEADGVVLRIANDEIGVFRPCMTLMGQWYANTDGQFVADLNAFSSHPDEKGCASVKEPADTAEVVPEWLARAAAFRAEGGERLLLDRDGGTVARLQPGAKPVKRSTMASEVTGVPVVTDETRAELNAVAAPLPANLTAATSATLLGKWKPDPMPQGTQEPGPFAEFLADGKWTGSDGCNGQGGRWLSGPNGSLLATQGPMTLIGCAGAPIGQWMTEARRAGFDGQTLVLLDGAGKEVGRLVE